MKKKLMRSILAVAVIATFFVANLTFAKESEPVQNDMQVIDAEDIGITPIQNIEEEEESEAVLEENEKNFEESEEAVTEEVPEVIPDEPKAEPEEDNEEEIEVPTEPEEHACKIVSCVSFDEDTCEFTLEEWCDICGDGTGRTITREEFDALEVDCDEEF